MNRLLTALLLFLTTLTFAADPVRHVEAAAAAKLIAEGKIVIIDVRTAEEFKEGHLHGAKNIDFMSEDFASQLAKLDRNKPTLVHCQGGGRSTRALPAFAKLGFTEVIHLDGGIAGWEKAGQPVEK